jgi:D-alanyl-D-alanine carboxypeptidase (penicillin-binding protein 5/6)
MKKRAFLNFLCFLLFAAVSVGQAGPFEVASAPSGSHVYRASVGPRPKSKPVSAAVKTEPAQAVPVAVSAPAATKPEPVADRAPAAAPAPAPAATKPASSKAAKKSSSKVVASEAMTAALEPAAAPKAAVKKAVEKAGSEDKATPKGEAPASAKDLFLNVKSAILINMNTGQVYYEHNADKTIQPASITKLLTLYLVREAMAQGRVSATTPIPVSAQAVKTGGSRMRLKRGEKVPLSELIKGISVVSANNACVAVAEYMGDGDPSKFVAQMNDKAKKIGMTSSRFRNPSGLPDRAQLSTARDIARLSMSYLRTFPESLKIHSMTTHTYHGSTHRNANTLLKTYKGVDGLKTGFVCEAGYNITATAKRGNTRLLAVVLGAQNSSVRQRETAKLLDFGFKRVERENGLGNRAAGPSMKPKV